MTRLLMRPYYSCSIPVATVALVAAAGGRPAYADPPAAKTATSPPTSRIPVAPESLFAAHAADFAAMTDTEDLYNAGADAYNAGQFTMAGAAFTRAMAVRKSFVDAAYARGFCLEHLKAWDAAIVDFTTVIVARPQMYDAFIERGRCRQKQGDAAGAKADLTTAKTLKPLRPEAYLLLGEPAPTPGAVGAVATKPPITSTSPLTGTWPPVVVAPSSPPKPVVPVKRSPADEFITSYTLPAIVITIPEPTTPPFVMPPSLAPFAAEFADVTDPDALFNLGATAYNAGQFGRAGAAFTKALRSRSSFTDANFARGNAFEALKDWKSAIADFDKVIVKKPKLYDAYVERARAYKMVGDLDKAYADVAMAETLKPERSDAYEIFGDPQPGKK